MYTIIFNHTQQFNVFYACTIPVKHKLLCMIKNCRVWISAFFSVLYMNCLYMLLVTISLTLMYML